MRVFASESACLYAGMFMSHTYTPSTTDFTYTVHACMHAGLEDPEDLIRDLQEGFAALERIAASEETQTRE